MIKPTLEHTFLAICHDADASEEEIKRRLGLYMSVNPLGPDVSIQMHAYIFSTADGRAPKSSVAHLKWMVTRVASLMDIGARVEKILGVIKANMAEIHKLRAWVSGAVSEQALPALPLNDFSSRVQRTKGLLEAVRTALTPPGAGDELVSVPAETVDVVGIFDHDRFFFQGEYPVPAEMPAGSSEFIAGLIGVKFGADAVRAFVESGRMDEIIATVEYVVKFYTGLLDQLERVVAFASGMFESYSTVGTAPTPAPSSLAQSKRDFSHVHVPEGVVHAEVSAVAAAASAAVVESEEDDDEPFEPSQKKRKYRKSLPKPLGFEPEGATTTTSTGRKQFPKPKMVSLSSMLMHCVEAVGYKAPEGAASLQAAGITTLVERLPPTSIVRTRLEEYHQADFRDRYMPALAKILVNYSYAEVPRNMKRITDAEVQHRDLLRMLYLEEHQRVSAGGAKPSFEELVSSTMDMSGLNDLFTLDDLREHLDVLFV